MKSSEFPSDVLIEILVKLPVKYVIRFTAVSKSWHSLITSPAFISTHLSQQTPLPHTLLVRRYDNAHHKEDYQLFQDFPNRPFCLNFSSQLNIPFNSENGYFHIVGICNGIICLCENLDGRVFLWNPCIQKFVTLPLPTISPQSNQVCALGFGANDDNDDYKLVRIVCTVPFEIEIFSLSTGVWRRLIGVGIKYYIEDWSEAFVNGNLHWIAFNVGDDNVFRRCIISFNITNEVFGEIMLPDALAGDTTLYSLSIKVFEGSLVVVTHGWDSYEVWVMKRYGVLESWTNLCCRIIEDMFEVVGFRSNGEVLCSTRSDKLVSYDPNTRQCKDLGIYGNPTSFYVENYKESLALLQGSNVTTPFQKKKEAMLLRTRME